MAMKDWKKIKLGYDESWKNVKTGEILSLNEYKGSGDFGEPLGQYFQVRTARNPEKTKNTRTKSQALAYARSYMRTH